MPKLLHVLPRPGSHPWGPGAGTVLAAGLRTRATSTLLLSSGGTCQEPVGAGKGGQEGEAAVQGSSAWLGPDQTVGAVLTNRLLGSQHSQRAVRDGVGGCRACRLPFLREGGSLEPWLDFSAEPSWAGQGAVGVHRPHHQAREVQAPDRLRTGSQRDCTHY